MSWLEPFAAGHRLAASFFNLQSESWEPVVTVTERDDFFVNWADFPGIHNFGDRLVVHWLQRQGMGSYDYGVRIAWSDDRGKSWSDPWTPHLDTTPTEHGFVSFFGGRANGIVAEDELSGTATSRDSGVARAGVPDAVWAVWLDGREMIQPGGPMTIRARQLPDGDPVESYRADNSPVTAPELILDGRTCECCQTDAVLADGVPIVVFRDRGDGEVRNIHVVRRLESGWTESVPIHDDGWVIGGCPVNGPALAAWGSQVAVAWFTAPDNKPQVNVAFSSDQAQSFGAPIRVDGGDPLGRVDLIAIDDDAVLVTWLERGVSGATEVIGRIVHPESGPGTASALVKTSEVRASGFPRVARLGPDRIMLAWTDASGDGQVRVSTFALDVFLSGGA